MVVLVEGAVAVDLVEEVVTMVKVTHSRWRDRLNMAVHGRNCSGNVAAWRLGRSATCGEWQSGGTMYGRWWCDVVELLCMEDGDVVDGGARLVMVFHGSSVAAV